MRKLVLVSLTVLLLAIGATSCANSNSGAVQTQSANSGAVKVSVNKDGFQGTYFPDPEGAKKLKITLAILRAPYTDPYTKTPKQAQIRVTGTNLTNQDIYTEDDYWDPPNGVMPTEFHLRLICWGERKEILFNKYMPPLHPKPFGTDYTDMYLPIGAQRCELHMIYKPR